MNERQEPPAPPPDKSGWVFESAMEFIPSPEPEFQQEFERGRSLMSAYSTTVGRDGELQPVSFSNGMYVGEIRRTYEGIFPNTSVVEKPVERQDVSIIQHIPWHNQGRAEGRAWLNGAEMGIKSMGQTVGRYLAEQGKAPADPNPNRIYYETIEHLANLNPYELPEELKQRILVGKPVVDIPEGRLWWGPSSDDPGHIIAAAKQKAEYDAMCKAHDEIEVRWLCGLAWLRGVLQGVKDRNQLTEQEKRKGSYT